MNTEKHVMPGNILQLMPCNTLQLMTIQHELLMSINLDLKLETMLHSFMQTCLSRLSLRSIHIYCFLDIDTAPASFDHKADFVSHLFSIPRNNGFQPHKHDNVYSIIKRFHSENCGKPITTGVHDTNYIVFNIRDFGVLVLDKQKLPSHISITDMLSPLVERLAMSCQACIKHVKLKSETEARRFAEKASDINSRLDPLTGLDNRWIFQQRLYQELARSLRQNTFGAVLIIDLDHFNKINDSLGHTVGDKLLTETAHRLRAHARAEDSIFRIGGDEFAILLNHTGPTREHAAHVTQDVAQRLCEALSEPVKIDELILHTTASIGIVLFPDETLSEDELATHSEAIVQHADLALFRSKKQGRNQIQFFRTEMQMEARRYHLIETQLRESIKDNRLHLVYQPLVDSNQKIIAAEALLRWNSPALGMIPPDEFIPIAEESGLIIEIGEWVLQAACSLLKEIHSENTYKLQYISVNISQKQFNHPEFVSTVKQIIRDSGISPELVRFEITESLLINNIESIVLKMSELSRFGIQFMLDDFGTGYSSLSSIQRLPISCIKIDKAFISNIHSKNSENMALTNAIISLMERININCIAEGIESSADAEFFRSKNIYALQGYYFYHPLAENDFIEALLNQSDQLRLA